MHAINGYSMKVPPRIACADKVPPAPNCSLVRVHNQVEQHISFGHFAWQILRDQWQLDHCAAHLGKGAVVEASSGSTML